jgi:hypothetical protein
MKKVRVGSGHGWWGDLFEPGLEIVKRGNIGYIAYDFLGEPTIPLLQQVQRKDPKKGYVPAISQLVRTTLPEASNKGTRIITNAGAANPDACAGKIIQIAREELQLRKLKVGVVRDPEMHNQIDEFRAKGIKFKNIDTGEEDIHEIRNRIVASYVYLGSELIVEALRQGADVVITGRTTDSAAVLGPLAYEFAWKWDDWDLLASGIAAGHLIECGCCCTGGISNLWEELSEPWNIGYPIIEMSEDGEFIVTKLPGTGGIVNKTTITEHLVYEVHDPSDYLLPEVVVDLSHVKLEEIAEDTIKVTGVRGKPRPDTLKICFAYTDGYIGEGECGFAAPNSMGKAKRAAEMVLKRLEMMKMDAEEVRVDYIGFNSILGPVAPPIPSGYDPNEIYLRVAAKCRSYDEAAKVPRVMTWLMGAGPIGATGQLNAQGPREVLALWPSLIPREEVTGELVFYD